MFQTFRNVNQQIKYRTAYVRWLRRGRPVPPPHLVKQMVVKDHARRFGLRVFVETGTLHGDMIQAVKRDFSHVYTIELSDTFFDAAKKRFSGDAHVTALHGDSGVVLPKLLEEIAEPCLFWLDGHYSGGTTARGEIDSPISAELEAIIEHPVRNHTVLIDDARDFVGKGGYPELGALEKVVLDRMPGYSFTVREDIIRIVPDGGDR